MLAAGFGAAPAVARATTHIPSTTYSVDTEWTLAGSPYVLDGSVTVRADATLTVDPGVIVKFNGTSRALTVNGALNAVGTAASHITFTSLQDDSVGGDTGLDGPTVGAPGQWYEIAFDSSGLGSRLSFADVRYGGWGSSRWAYGEVDVDSGATGIAIDHSDLSYSQNSGLIVGINGQASVSASAVTHNGYGISVNTGSVAVSGRSSLSNNSGYGIWLNLPTGYPQPASTIFDSDVTENGSYGIYIGANGDYPRASMPHGSRNNIYGNHGNAVQLTVSGYPGFRLADVNWNGNYWGPDAYYWYSPGVCSANGYAAGHVAYRASSANPPAGPISGGSNYYFSSGGTTYYCGVRPPSIWSRASEGPASFESQIGGGPCR